MSTPRLLLLLLCLPLAWPATAVDLPSIGPGSLLTPAQERVIGEEVMQRLRGQLNLLDDPTVGEWLEQLGQRLARHDRHGEGMRFDFFLVDDTGINAFALPGGFIGVHGGLILAARDEDEVAAVLAHEIAHITQRHLARRWESHSRMNVAGVAAILAAIVIAQQNPQVGEAALATATAGLAQMQLNHSRSAEQEADRIGMRTLALAGYDPEAMATFFERLYQTSRLHGPQALEFLQTHPVTDSRIADARSRLGSEARPPRRAGIDFRIARARLQVLMSRDTNRAITTLRESLTGGHHASELEVRYGLAFALLRAGQPDAAHDALAPLLARHPEQPALLSLQGEIASAAGRHHDAMHAFETAWRIAPYRGATLQPWVEALLAQGDPATARQRLRETLRQQPEQIPLHRLLARVEFAGGNPAAAALAHSDALRLQGDLASAIAHLEAARRDFAMDYFHASRIDARLEELRRNQRERAVP